MKQLQTALAKNSKKIDKFFDFYLPIPKGLQKKLIDAMRYSTIGSGKKIPFGKIIVCNRNICCWGKYVCKNSNI